MRLAEIAAHASEVRDRAVLPEDGMGRTRPVEARPDDFASRVDLVCRLLLEKKKRPQVRHRAVLPEERPSRAGCVSAPSHDLARVVDGERLPEIATKGPEVGHRAVLPEGGMIGRGTVVNPADDLAGVVDAIGIRASPVRG